MSLLRRILLVVALMGALVEGLVSPGLDGPASAAEPRAARPACHRTLPTYPIVRPGDRGRSVATLQCSLNDVGVGPVAVDGFYGPQTKAAVKQVVDTFEGEPARPYRINNGFWVLLFGRQLPDHRIAVGAHGHAVRVLQRALRAAGADLVVDGDFGLQTERAVKQYQAANDVRQTGVVDRHTRFYLAMGGVIGHLN